MYSMTGMGRAEGTVLEVPIRIEIKAVNHRFCDINFRSPVKYSGLEINVQKLVKTVLTRGRIDIFVNEDKNVDLSALETSAFKSYYKYLLSIKELLNINEEISLPQVMTGVNSWIQKETDRKTAWLDLEPIITNALKDLNEMRLSEGKRLKQDLKEKILTIDKIRGNILDQYPKIKLELESKIKQRIGEKIQEFTELDPQRLAMEVTYSLDRMEITEELDRIKSHIKQAQKFLEAQFPVGRKLEFLLQEFNREFNTIASKCSNPDVSYLVVDAKSEIEKIREQIQNIE